ncbi:YcdB/YcdC domain-containing protein [Paenibacillus sp.]|uniref:YcdB/YcdC domain-containing protein n=1 Tax=Paenibacillus sp. TaxID=58172 RepID=UPI0028125584|nr:YcdB/YcdC domain-containing protein [Paenibacillus sp.]
MGNQRKKMKRFQAAVVSTMTLTMVMGAALPAWAARTSASASAGASVGTVVDTAVDASDETSPNGSATMSVTEETANISGEEAEARMKKLFPALREAKLDHIRFGSDRFPPAREAVWNLNWSVTSADGRGTHGFSTEMDAMTGDVLSMYVPEFVLGEPSFYPPKVSREEARKTAEALVKRAVPSLDGVALSVRDADSYDGALFGPFRYSFYFETEHHGIPVTFRSVHVGIDGNGNATQLSYQPLPDDMPPAANPIAKEKVMAAYEEHLELQLAYVNLNPYREEPKWALAWVPAPSHSGVMDAITGDWIGFDGMEIPKGDAAVRYEAIAPSAGAAYQPARPEGKTITRAQAEEIVASVYRLPDDYELEQHSLQEDFNVKRSVWRLTWREGSPSPMGFPPGVTATVDAENGQVYEIRKDLFSPYGALPKPEQETGKPISETEAKRKADDLVAKLFPDAKETLKRIEGSTPGMPPNPSEDEYTFVYQPFRNEYPLQDASVRLQLSKDGQLVSYAAWSSGPVPEASELPKKAAFGKAEAERLWLERSDLALRYDRFGGYYVDNGERVEEKIRLTYRHEWKSGNEAFVLDAATGKWVSRGFGIPQPTGEPVDPIDIEGHAAESDLRTLAQFRVLDADEGGRANPDGVITRAQWSRWLAAALNPHYANEGYYGPNGTEEKPYYADVSVDDELHKAFRVLAMMGWIGTEHEAGSSFGSDEGLTREELAIWAAHVLGYDRLAELLGDDPVIGGASDVGSIEHPGAAALSVKLQLLNIEDGRWNPDKKVTRAEAASFLMKLVRLQSSVDQPVNGR